MERKPFNNENEETITIIVMTTNQWWLWYQIVLTIDNERKQLTNMNEKKKV